MRRSAPLSSGRQCEPGLQPPLYLVRGPRGPEVYSEHDDLCIHPTSEHNLEIVILLVQVPLTSGRASLRRTDVIVRTYVACLRITGPEAMMGLFGGQWRTGTCTTTPGAPLPGIGNSRKHYAGSLCGKAVISLCVQANS